MIRSFQSTLACACLLAGFAPAIVHGADPAYLPIKGSAWRLALADVDGDGRNELVYGAYEGAVRCVEPETGRLRWEQPIGGFPFALMAKDVDGDGRSEVYAAVADGGLYAFAPNGNLLWVFRSSHALYDVAAGDVVSGGNLEIVCGGVDRRVTILSSAGMRLADFGVTRIVQRLAVDDFDGDGRADVFVMDGHTDAKMLRYTAEKLELVWQRRLTPLLPSERGLANFFVFTATSADLDGDKSPEILLGGSFYNSQAVLALSASGRPLWQSESIPRGFIGENSTEGMSMAVARVAEILPDAPGREIAVVAGNVIRLLDANGKIRQQAAARVGFTDAVLDGRILRLGSSPNGDETVYRIDFAGDWVEQIGGLKRQGKIRRIEENLERVQQQVLAYRPPKAGAALPVVPIWRWGPDAGANDWIRREFPYPNLQFVRTLSVKEPMPVLDSAGQPWNASYWKPPHTERTMTPDEMVAAARQAEAAGVPTLFYMGHSCTPWISLETADRILQAAPTAAFGFLSAEDEQLERLERYYRDYLGPLADLCARHGGKVVMAQNKGAWWWSSPSLPGVFESLAVGERGRTMVGTVEDSNSRTPELNIFGRMGLWMAGLLGRIDVRAISDHFSFSRLHQWEYPRSGHPFLRVLVAHMALGAGQCGTIFRDVRRTGDTFELTEMGRESIGIFFHLLGKGLVVPPRPDQMVGVARIGFVVHPPPLKWLEDAHNGHNPERWSTDPEMHNAVFPHTGVTWGMTPTPTHALQRVLLEKERQFGTNVPATPYGPFVCVPAQADRSRVPFVEEWWHTDGVYAWKEGGPKLAGMAAATAVRADFERAAKKLPFRATGHVFLQTHRMDDGTYRLYLIDPGWLDPADRDVTLRVQMEGDYTLRDLLSGEAISVRDRVAPLVVPAGTLRILEARRKI